GAPGEDAGATADAGGVTYLPGSGGGLATAGSRLYAQGAGGVGGTAERGDRFGAVLEAGQANAGGPADLVVGAPSEAVGQAAGSGAVSVLYGAAGGPSGTGDLLLFQGGGGLPDEPEAGDGFGSALAVGQLDGDGFADLAVGIPGEEYFASADIGDVILVHGTAGGLSGAGGQSLILNSGVGSNEAGDRIGSALAARDFDDDGAGDLAVGMPGEDIGTSFRDAGAIAYHQGPVLSGNRTESRPLHADSTGVPGAAEPGDRFGSALGPGPLGG
ncbi:MAG TPA: FG-GAP repeat protein, partial [Actinomycetes bacterium]|nr:FG-GAP repeat protein [Actinomycetes bacterium]